MPHLNIKHFPANFTDEQRKALAEALTKVVLENFDTYEDAVSIALEPVQKTEWNDTVVTPEIRAREHLLLKAPNYRK